MPEVKLLDPAEAIILMREQQQKPVENLPYHDPAVKAWWNFSENVVARTFGDGHRNHEDFAFRYTFSGTVEEQQGQHRSNIADKKALLGSFIAQLERMPSTGTGAVTVEREGFFFAGQNFDAMLRTAKLLQSANVSIVIIDNYFGQAVLQLLGSKRPGVTAQVLMSPTFLAKPQQAHLRPLFVNFNAQHGNSLSVRTTTTFHDRFVILDGADFFHFGASLEHLGNKGFMFSRIEEPDVIAALKTRFNTEWGTASQIV